MRAVNWPRIKKTFYKRLNEERERRGWSKSRMADECEIDREEFALYEGSNMIFPRSTDVIWIATVLDCSIDYLFGLTDEREVRKG